MTEKTATAKTVQPKLKMTSPRVPEKARQSAGVALLRSFGYTVIEIGQSRRPVFCRQCRAKNWPTYTDSDTGAPDTVVTCEGWRGASRFQEWKADGTPRRPAQLALVGMGVSAFVTTWQEAARDVLAFEARLGLEPNARLAKLLEGEER